MKSSLPSIEDIERELGGGNQLYDFEEEVNEVENGFLRTITDDYEHLRTFTDDNARLSLIASD